jgi:hypothetical protein
MDLGLLGLEALAQADQLLVGESAGLHPDLAAEGAQLLADVAQPLTDFIDVLANLVRQWLLYFLKM